MTATAIAVATPSRNRNPAAGVGRLIRFALRRDRVRLPAWVLGISLSLALTAAAFPGIYPDAAARQARASLIGSPATIALAGPQIGVADYTFGAMMTNEMLALTSIVVALMSIFTVVRHTRAEEESGRSELVLSNPVGRFAPLATGLAVAVLANVALAVLNAVLLGAVGVESITWAGSWLFGAALAGVGLVFAGVAGVTSQISEHARAASSLAGLMLGVAYSIRAVGDVLDSGLSWLSPVAWAQRTYAYVDDRWWPLLLSLVTTLVLIALAMLLNARRDFGAGLRQPRPGPATASPRLASAFSLALHNQRVALTAWSVSLFLFGLMYGTLLGEVEGFGEKLGDTIGEVLGPIGTESLIKSFLSLLAVVMSMMGAVYAAIAMLRARAEETSGLAEAVLATPTSRARYLAGHTLVALGGGGLVLLGGAIGIGLTGSVALGDREVLGQVLSGAVVQFVPVVLVVAFAVALFGLVPQLSALVWVPVGYGMVATMIGGLLGLPDWALNISPWALVPMMPAQEFAIGPVLGVLAGSTALLLAGFWGFRRRDLQTVA
ncbi:MAG: ABC transporter permease [Candidatus Nanopelagicales bacterium]